MIEALDTAIVELDDADGVAVMNAAAELCLGTGRERARGESLSALPGVPEELLNAVIATRRDQRRRHLRECRLAGGLYDCNIQPLERAHVLLELYSLRWEQQRQQLQQREVQTGMLESLRRNLGHEIRNPLGGIRGAAQMLAEELDDHELGTLARLIMREVDRINELTQRFGEVRIEREQLDIHRVADEAVELLLAESGGEARVTRDYDPSIPPLSGDVSAVRQVLLNLVRNAWQAGAGSIVVRTRVEHGPALMLPGQQMLLRTDVEDDGEGVPEALRAMLFLPLVSGRRDGSGLGLALSQQIAAAHGGLLSYQPLETGSRFTLRLPLNGSEDQNL
ncbi:MAG: PAS domain-containing sensor histidine kinase [Xanthomonadales bacterium]|nr:PAS domain-containing sensor histidine kinase [Xanthomonadales bacterium]